MTTNKERIMAIYKMNAELQVLLEAESDEYKKATANRKNKLTIERNGKKVKVTEGELWEEIRIVGLKSSSVKIMGKKYPKVLEIAEKRDKKNKELHDFIQKEFGFSFQQMTLADYLKMTEAMIDYKLEEYNERKKSKKNKADI